MPYRWAGVMLAWLLGTALQLQQAHLRPELDVGMATLGALAGLCAGLAMGRSSAWRGHVWIAWALSAALSGWALAELRAHDRAEQVWPAALGGADIHLEGRIDSLPVNDALGTRFEVVVEAVEHDGHRWLPGQLWPADRARGPAGQAARVPERVSLSWPSRWQRAGDVVRPEDLWRWSVRFRDPASRRNPGAYDSALVAFQRGVRAQGRVTGGDEPLRLDTTPRGLTGHLARWRAAARDRILAEVGDRRAAGLIAGLTVGDQSAIHADDWESMRTTGTAHLAAISGLHITMMGWLVAALVGRLWRLSPGLMLRWPAPTASRWAGVLGAWLYAVLAGWGIPAQRTVLMLATVVALRSGARRWPWPLVLLAAAVVVTLRDPWALIQAGFWLSFAAIGLLMLAGAADVTVPTQGRWAAWRDAARSLWRNQSVASVGLAPLSLVFFQSASVVGLLVNLVCIPWFTVVITPLALLGLLLPACWVALTPLVRGTLSALDWIASWPWAMVEQAEVGAASSVLALLGLVALLGPWPRAWRWWGLPLLAPLCLPAGWSQRLPPPPSGQVQVVAADVGQGTAVLVRTARHALLYDTGPRWSDELDAGRGVLVGLLRAAGVRRLDELVISHGDTDHIGGAASILRRRAVDRLRSTLPADHALLSQATRQHPGGAPHEACTAGQRWQWDGVDFEVLAPTQAQLDDRDHISDNDLSCVIRVQAGGRAVLLTGDLEREAEQALVDAHGEALAAEVLMVPHHGSRTSSTPALLDAVAPAVAVIQAGRHNSYGHPHADVVARYRLAGIRIVETAHCGSWVWSSDERHPGEGRCWSAERPRYWR